MGVEKLRSGSSRLTGYTGIGLAAVFAAAVLADGYHDRDWVALLGCVTLGFAFWVAVLRPYVAIDGDVLVVRSTLSEARVPLASVEQVDIQQYFSVRAGGQTWTSAGLGRTRRQIYRLHKGTAEPGTTESDVLEERIRQAADNLRAKLGVSAQDDEQFAMAASVRRLWAWPVAGVLAALMVAFVVALLV